MKLIVGLGNPGKKYDKTRHNVGFEVLDLLNQRGTGDAGKEKFSGKVTELMLAGERVMLLWPLTLMNRSGQSVREAVKFYQLPTSDVLVVCDDFNLPLGKLRFRPQGSAGGQKGLADIIQKLGTEEIARLRIGIGPVPDAWDAADFVLAKFAPADQPMIEDTIIEAANGVESWVANGIAVSMNRFN